MTVSRSASRCARVATSSVPPSSTAAAPRISVPVSSTRTTRPSRVSTWPCSNPGAMKYAHSFAIAFIVLVAPLAGAAEPCKALTKFSLPGHRLVIREVQELPASAPGVSPAVPAHCRVDGVIDERTGRDGKPYGIGFALALPAKWNGRFLFQGGGGLNGSVQPPVGGAYASKRSALMRGFAVASTDSGHKGQ